MEVYHTPLNIFVKLKNLKSPTGLELLTYIVRNLCSNQLRYHVRCYATILGNKKKM